MTSLSLPDTSVHSYRMRRLPLRAESPVVALSAAPGCGSPIRATSVRVRERSRKGLYTTPLETVLTNPVSQFVIRTPTHGFIVPSSAEPTSERLLTRAQRRAIGKFLTTPRAAPQGCRGLASSGADPPRQTERGAATATIKAAAAPYRSRDPEVGEPGASHGGGTSTGQHLRREGGTMTRRCVQDMTPIVNKSSQEHRCAPHLRLSPDGLEWTAAGGCARFPIKIRRGPDTGTPCPTRQVSGRRA